MSLPAHFLVLDSSLSTIFPDVRSHSLQVSNSTLSAKLSNLWHPMAAVSSKQKGPTPCNSEHGDTDGSRLHLLSLPVTQKHLTSTRTS